MFVGFDLSKVLISYGFVWCAFWGVSGFSCWLYGC